MMIMIVVMMLKSSWNRKQRSSPLLTQKSQKICKINVVNLYILLASSNILQVAQTRAPLL